MRSISVLVLAGLVSGCAGRDFYYQVPDNQNPPIIPDTYEAGEVVGVELVAPTNRVAYDCYQPAGYWNALCQSSPGVRDAVPLRGPDGKINFFPGGRLLSPFAVESDIPDDTIGVQAARAQGWRIYNTVRLENDAEITVVDSTDKGFTIGELVRVAFQSSPSGRWSNQVYLLGPGEEVVDLAGTGEEAIERREPPGPWGRINAQLEHELSQPLWPGGYLLDRDPELLTEQEQIVLRFSGLRLLGAMEEEYVDFTLGVRSEKELRDPIGAIFETNLGFGIRDAWTEYEQQATPEFARWFDSNFLRH